MIISIDPQIEQPIYAQIRDQIVMGIAGGQVSPGEQLPSVRRLAADLGINPHTVNKAYSILGDEGYLISGKRKKAVIADKQNVQAELADFTEELSAKISVDAAAARVHGLTETEFAALCTDCYRQSANV
jgi:DNA-binding transcriptional regulator YhcF (GntR family)